MCSLFWIQSKEEQVNASKENVASAMKNDFSFRKDKKNEKESILGRVILVRLKECSNPSSTNPLSSKIENLDNNKKPESEISTIKTDFEKVYGLALYFQNIPEVLRMTETEAAAI